MINDADNEYARWNKLFQQVRGRFASRDEFRQSAVGKSWLTAIEILSDDAEADQAEHAQEVGQVAVRDKWDEQIYSLRDQVTQKDAQISELQSKLADQDIVLKSLQSQIDDLTHKLNVVQSSNGDATKWQTLKTLIKELLS